VVAGGACGVIPVGMGPGRAGRYDCAAQVPWVGAACVRRAGARRAGLWPGGGTVGDGVNGGAPKAVRARRALRSRSAWRRCDVPVVAMSARSRCTIGIRNPAVARIAAVQVFLEQGIVHRAAPVPGKGHDGAAAAAVPISKTDSKWRINDGRGMRRRVTMVARAVAWWPPARPRLTYSRYHFRAPAWRPFFSPSGLHIQGQNSGSEHIFAQCRSGHEAASPAWQGRCMIVKIGGRNASGTVHRKVL